MRQSRGLSSPVQSRRPVGPMGGESPQARASRDHAMARQAVTAAPSSTDGRRVAIAQLRGVMRLGVMDWEIYDGQAQRGPMPEAGICDAIRSGLPRNAYVRQAGTSEWIPIETHPLFAAALQQRGAPGHWAPPPPPPPAYVGSAQATVPASGPPPATPYAVSGPHAGQAARRKLTGRGCLVQGIGVVSLLGAGVGLSSHVDLMVQAVAALAILGCALVLVGGLLNLKWVCGLCKQPIAGRSVLVCPSCHASFT